MLRRLYPHQPESFAFTDANGEWARTVIARYPEDRKASAVIPLLWRAQEQEGWVTKPAIEYVAEMLDLAEIRVLEVATFYFMFQLQPVGEVAHFQICGTTSCMICGAEDLIAVCREKIAPNPHEISADGKFSWEEVECLGACSNAPMAQIGKDYYEDLTAESFRALIDAFARGEVPAPGPQNGRFASEPAHGLTSLTDLEKVNEANASVTLAREGGDTIKRIDGTEPASRITVRAANEEPLSEKQQARQDVSADPEQQAARESAPGYGSAEDDGQHAEEAAAKEESGGAESTETPADKEPDGDTQEAVSGSAPEAEPAAKRERPAAGGDADEAGSAAQERRTSRPEKLDAPREDGPDDLKRIRGVGPKLEDMLHSLGFYHFDQIARWTAEEVAWVDDNLEGFKGRVTRDEWVAQAKHLAEGGETAFSKKVDDGEIYE